MLFPIAAFMFLAAFCAVIAIGLGVSGRRSSPGCELKRRLRQLAKQGVRQTPADLRSEIGRAMAPADRFLSRLPYLRNLEKKLDHAGVRLSVSVFVMITAALAITGAAVAMLLTGSISSGVPAAAASALLAAGYLRIETERRSDKFTELFPDALAMISRSLRAGHSLTSAIQLVGRDISNPVGELFKTAYDQQQFGFRMTEGLSKLNERVDSLDLRFFTTAVGINSEVGGNLSEILDKLSVTIRDRLRIRRQIRVYTAQGRLSGYILGALPIITFILLNVLNPAYESALSKEPIGRYALVSAACMQLVGLLIIRNIIKIKV